MEGFRILLVEHLVPDIALNAPWLYDSISSKQLTGGESKSSQLR